jgi:hypothetical protein
MTPEAFVAALKASVRSAAASEADYLAHPPSPQPPQHLARFSAWFRQLSTADQAVAREVIQYTAEGSLFGLLTYLDNLASLATDRGTIEVWYIGSEGQRVRLNDPDGELLKDLFNMLAEPDAAAK